MQTFQRKVWALLLVVVMVVLAGCAGTATTAPEPSAAAPTSGASSAATEPVAEPTSASAPASEASNTLVYAVNMSDLITVDPATMYAWTGILVVHNLYDTLVQFEGTDVTTVKPALAESWNIEDGGDTWDMTFHLRSGVKFASGNDLTADDVVYSFQRVVALQQGPAFLFTNVAGLTADSFQAPDPQTVVIQLPKTASPQVFLSILTFTVGGIVDSKEVKAHEVDGDMGSAWLLDHSAGSGPYVIDHWTKEVEVLLTANPSYSGNVGVQNVLIKHVLESTNQQFGLEKGDIDIARNLSPEQIAAEAGKEGVTTAKGDSLLLVYIGMNQAMPVLQDNRVREALRMAVDYNGIVDGLMNGNAKVVQTLVPSGLLGYNPDTPFQQDIEGAKALLKEAGQDQGLTLELLAPTGTAPGGAAWSDIAAKLQSDFAQIGVTVNIKQTTYAELYDVYRAQTHELIMVEWGPDYPDPDGNISPFVDFSAGSIASRQGWDDPELGEQARAATLIADPAERAAAYQDITETVLHNGPYLVLYQPNELFGLRSNVQGFEWKPSGWIDFSKITK